MPERISKLPVRAAVPSFPSISISMGRARAFQGIASILGGITSELEDQADDAAVIQAKRKAVIAAATGAPELTGESTLAGAAFDAAALSTYSNRIEIQARQRLVELEAENPANPAEFHKKATGYLSGVTTEINNVDEGLAVLFQAQMELYRAQAAGRISKQFNKVQKEIHEGVVKNLSDVLSRDVGKAVGGLLTGPEELQIEAIAAFTAGINRHEVALNEIGADGQTKIKPEKIVELSIEFRDGLMEKAIKGWFGSFDDRTEASEELFTGKFKNETVQILFDALDGKSQNRIKSELIRDESRLAAIANRRREELEGIAEERAIEMERDILFGENSDFKRNLLFNIIRNSPHLTTARVERLDAFIRNGGRDEGVDIQRNVLEVERLIRNKDLASDVAIINEVIERGGVSLETMRTRLIPLMEAMQDEEWADALREGQARLGYDKSAASAGLFPDRRDKALKLEAQMLELKRLNDEKRKAGEPIEDVVEFMQKKVALHQKSINQTAALGLPIMAQKYRSAQLSGSAKQIASARSALIAVLVSAGVVDALTASSGGFDPLAAIDQRAKQIRGQ